MPGRAACPAGGAPCRDREKAFILAWMSEGKPLDLMGAGAGLRAALTLPSGVEDWVIEGAWLVRREGGFEGGESTLSGSAVKVEGSKMLLLCCSDEGAWSVMVTQVDLVGAQEREKLLCTSMRCRSPEVRSGQ